MNKSEKIIKIKALQESISNNVKEKKFSPALEDVNELLALAPNLEKIQELKLKLESQLAKKPPVLPPTNEQSAEAEKKPSTNDKKELKIEAAGKPVEKKAPQPSPDGQSEKKKLSTQEEEKLLEELMQHGEIDEPEKAGGKAESINGRNGLRTENGQVLFEEELSFNVGKEDVLTPEAVEAKLQKLLLQEKEQYKDDTSTEENGEDIYSRSDMTKKGGEKHEKSEYTDLDDFDLETLITKEKKEPLPTIKAKLDEGTKVVTPITKPQEKENTEIKEKPVPEGEPKPDLQVIQKTTPKPESPKTEAGNKPSPFIIKDSSSAISKPAQDKIKIEPKPEKQAPPSFTMPKKLTDEDQPIAEPVETPIFTGPGKKNGGSFKLSNTEGMHPSPDISVPTYIAPPDLDKKIGDIKKEGFNLRNIAQGIGFVFNLERLLYSTVGLMFIIVISKILSSILPSATSIVATPVITLTLIMILSTFIAFTVIKQIDYKIHSDFKQLFPEFNRELLIPSALFWIIWMALIGILIAALAIITVVGKLGSIGTLLYSVLSPVSFLITLIIVSLILASGLISFIAPAIIAVDKPGLFAILKEVLFSLKNHLFTILGGFIINFILNLFVMAITLLALTGTYAITVLTLLGINPGYLVRFVSALPPFLQMVVMQLSPDIGTLLSSGMVIQPSGAIETIGFYLFIITMTAGSLFLISIPFIFQNAAAVITFLTVKSKPQFMRKN